MNIPVNIFMWLLACLPIIVLLVLMIKFQWGATDAAPIGLAITIFTGIVFYKADLKVIVSEASKGIWNALTILVIVWTAVLLYQVGNETRAFLVIRDGMRRLLPNELLRGTGGSRSSASDRDRSEADVGSYYPAFRPVLGEYFWHSGSSVGCLGDERRNQFGK